MEEKQETFQEYISRKLKEMEGRPLPELPYIFGNSDADIFCIQWTHNPVYHKQINSRMDLIYDMETNEVVGVELWGQKERILEQVLETNLKGGDV